MDVQKFDSRVPYRDLIMLVNILQLCGMDLTLCIIPTSPSEPPAYGRVFVEGGAHRLLNIPEAVTLEVCADFEDDIEASGLATVFVTSGYALSEAGRLLVVLAVDGGNSDCPVEACNDGKLAVGIVRSCPVTTALEAHLLLIILEGP